MDSIKWCCFCLLGPCLKELKTPYTHSGITQTYCDMFEECFQIQLTLGNEEECGICESCEGRLRDANDFKQQVQRSQTELRARLNAALPAKDETETDGEVCGASLLHAVVKLEPAEDFSGDEILRSESPDSETPLAADTDVSLPIGAGVGRPGEFRYNCDYCDKKFQTPSKLKTHSRTHTGEKPFSCRICTRNFAQLAMLKRHERIHTGERPYVCKLCKKTFAELCTLQRHERIHTGERPFPCSMCTQKFSQLSNLKTHERTHTGEKPYICDVCQRPFARLSYVKKHKESIHAARKPA